MMEDGEKAEKRGQVRSWSDKMLIKKEKYFFWGVENGQRAADVVKDAAVKEGKENEKELWKII